MSKVVVFDFVCDTAVAVAADLGTDPNSEELKLEAVQMLIQKLVLGQAEVHCDNVFDPDTGLHGHPDNILDDLKVGDYDAGI